MSIKQFRSCLSKQCRPNEVLQNVASDLGLHCLLSVSLLRIIMVVSGCLPYLYGMQERDMKKIQKTTFFKYFFLIFPETRA